MNIDNAGSDDNQNQNADANAGGNADAAEKMVKESAYLGVSKDMHKYKREKEELKAELAKAQADIKAAQEAKLEEQEKWKELAEKRAQELAEKEQIIQNTNQHFKRSVKMTAMIRELGDIDPKYLSHADLDSIEVLEDGTLNSESVAAAANKFRKENPLLIPSDDAGNITDTAALNGAPVQTGQKAYSEMTPEEKIDFMTNAPSLKDKS